MATTTMNILILGESGVGKSTWINGFINFLSYKSLKDAEKCELISSLIPSKFTVCDENFDEVLVSSGIDDNEVLQAGDSATQDTKVYPFTIGTTTIRLIDTPGIGDTRGIDQDKKNFENILATLSHLDEIHGICILLKPNNARLNVMFRFCIKELLTHFHKDAAKNIIFCFTNSRGTFYRPGDTMPALKNLLKEKKTVKIPVNQSTVYCFDSEACRYLAAVKNDPPVKFPDSQKAQFSGSWRKFATEMKRMLKHIYKLPSHKVQETLTLNHSRELVFRLAEPLAEIARNIQTNNAIIEDEKGEIENIKVTIDELKKKTTTITEIEVRSLPHPRTVCSNSKCVKVWSVNNVATTIYSSMCHEPCQCNISGVKADTIGDPGLMQCWAMVNGYCRLSSCGHHYREHMRVNHESVEVKREVGDQSVVQSLDENMALLKSKQEIVDAKTTETLELSEEQKKIKNASMGFASYIKENAIVPYNDAMEGYLDHLIRAEEEEGEMEGCNKKLEELRRIKGIFIEQKIILEREMNVEDELAENITHLGDNLVENMMSELTKLKHSGKLVEDAMKNRQVASSVVFKETEFQLKTYKRNFNFLTESNSFFVNILGYIFQKIFKL